ncbi:Hypothetical protein GLP15_2526 [Giardia lamblia P15]|uniref:Uncharacterized protein n=1 Tax=Giardia intestinalis (strain P15) TaxID=658858 RepID=E1EXC2_GIAIA|nr:Hypothetical protein GLP15_2526 [Giardia lamblia P15]
MVCGILHMFLFYVTLGYLNPGPEYSIVEPQELLAVPDTALRVHIEDVDGSILECAYTPLHDDTRETFNYRYLLRTGALQSYLNELMINLTIDSRNIIYTMESGISMTTNSSVEYIATVSQLGTQQMHPYLSYRMAASPTRDTEELWSITMDSSARGCILDKDAIENFINETFNQPDLPDWIDEHTRNLYRRAQGYAQLHKKDNPVLHHFYYRTSTADLFHDQEQLHKRIANYAPFNSLALMRIQTLYEGICKADSSKQAVANVHLTCLPGAATCKLISILIRHDMCGHDIVFGCDYVCNVKEIYEAVRESWQSQTVKCARTSSKPF